MTMQLKREEISLLSLSFERALDDCRYYIADKTAHIAELDQLDATKYQQRHNQSLSEQIAFWQDCIKKEKAKMQEIEDLYKKITGNDLTYIPF